MRNDRDPWIWRWCWPLAIMPYGLLLSLWLHINAVERKVEAGVYVQQQRDLEVLERLAAILTKLEGR